MTETKADLLRNRREPAGGAPQITAAHDQRLPSGWVEQVRTGGVAPLGNSGIQSGINKHDRGQAISLGFLGFDGDEQAETFHGGSERAVLQYDLGHYDLWRAELPALSAHFKPGAFGENLVVRGMNESNMCIGDVVAVGSALLQVTESRAPCFKLNHRFGYSEMARLTQDTRRTGLFYRVLIPGIVQAGDRIQTVSRPMPEWPVELVQHYMYSDTADVDAATELADIPFMSRSFRGIFRRRVENAQVEDWSGRLSNGPITSLPVVTWFDTEVTQILDESASVKSFRFKRFDGGSLPDYAPGAHVQVKLPNGLTRSYSLCELADGQTFRIAVGRVTDSRGGSIYMHESVKVGDKLTISEPANFFPLAEGAKRHLLVAGGIGITPFPAMIARLEQDGAEWRLFYITRRAQDAAFAAELQARYPDRLQFYVTGEGGNGRPDFFELFSEHQEGDHVYCCGSPGVCAALRDATSHWSDSTVHFEAFQPLDDANAQEFKALVPSTGSTISVPPNQSLLSALRAAGFAIPSSCETGTCGTCRLRYRKGEVIHNDVVLSARERQTELISCVSRARGDVELDL